MALKPSQIAQIARKTAEARRIQKRLDAAPSPALERDHQKTAQAIMQRRRAKQHGHA